MSQTVCICIFPIDDGQTTEERLRTAAEKYREAADSALPARPDSSNSDASLWAIARTEQGKPYFVNQPNLHFSISHSGPYWACAMTGGSVGLDIQEHTTLKNESRAEAADRYSRMASRFFHPSEAAYVRSEAREDCYNRFFQVWTARESYVKYTGLGIDRDFGQLCVIPAAGLGTPGVSAQNDPFSCPPAEPHRFLSWQAEGAFFLETEFPENFTLCLCTEKQAEVLLLPMIQASDGTFPGSPHG